MENATSTQVPFVLPVLQHGRHLDEGTVFSVIILLVLQSMVWKYDLQRKEHQ